jgi:hypothetical protein
MAEREDRRIHDLLDFVGVRAHVTATAVLQICGELHRAGVFDDAALDRIKDAMAKEIALARNRGVFSEEYAHARTRLEELFAGRTALHTGPEPQGGVGAEPKPTA